MINTEKEKSNNMQENGLNENSNGHTENGGRLYERSNYLLDYTPPMIKNRTQHSSTGQLNGYSNFGGGFSLFTNWNNNVGNNGINMNPNNSNINNNNFNNTLTPPYTPNLFDNENKNKSRSQEFQMLSPEFTPIEPLTLGITPLKYSPSFRNSWDNNGLEFPQTHIYNGYVPPSVNYNGNYNGHYTENNGYNNNNGNGYNMIGSNNNSPNSKTSFFTSEKKDELKPKIPPFKFTPTTGGSTPFHQWALNKSKKINEQQQQQQQQQQNGSPNTNLDSDDLDFVSNGNERYADTDFSEHVEHPSRTLFVRNLANNVDLEKLKELFEKYGPIRNMYTQAKYRGFVMISFFDIRHAKAAKTNLQSKRISGKKLDIHFALPKDTSNGTNDKVVNQGTLVVFNLDATITNEQLIQVFGKHGEIKDIRETPNKKSHKFIEFFDVRDAQKALVALNKTQIGSKTIKIEPSRPGGSGKNFRRNSAPTENSDKSNLLNQRQSMNFDSPSYQPSYKYPPENGTSSGSPSNNTNQEISSPQETPVTKFRYKQNSLGSPLNMSEMDQNIIDIDLIKQNLENRTTLMVRNIPNKYTQALLLESIDLKHKGKYDFFYLPIDFGNKCNMGYAFINLTSPLEVVTFYEVWNDCRWSHFNSDKVCSISFARIQGRNTLEQHFLASSVMTEDKGRRPMFFDDGVEVTDQLILRDRNSHN
eukprot:TRINITY_DN4360_c0_g1_i1.p1 TRINITY_DN4360_c0_g1~~TRINITY_DN4360_c0_g1_i1.p1  ORF type:complete len:700 (-),score=194.47 TRINITY_DN4360_c0_g1_i1:176-2275(-)